jgi:murein L,D-transpeptidase YcbB/YkuD
VGRAGRKQGLLAVSVSGNGPSDTGSRTQVRLIREVHASMPTVAAPFLPRRARRVAILASCSLLAVCGAAVPSSAQPATVQDAIRSRVEEIRMAPARALRGTTLHLPQPVAAFFESRLFAPAWTIPSGAAQVIRAVREIEADGLTPRDYHLAAIESALEERSTAPSVTVEADLQILMTDALAAMVDHVRYGKVDPASLDERWNVDSRIGAAPPETVLEQLAGAPSLRDAVESFKPNHFIYVGLKGALARYRQIAARGGWPTVPAGPTLKPGASDPRVRLVRRRLAATGELDAAGADAGDELDEALVEAVKKFQERHRITADGAIGTGTLDAMNVPVAVRIDQLRVNLERCRWVINGLRDSFVLVNLPAFKVYVIRDTKNVWETRAQIGREARQTPSFRADMRYIVFNPDWTVPPTILREDVLKPMASGTNALKKKGLTVLDRQGNVVDPSTIDWKTARASNFPYTLRQAPGANNALGRVKFMFPNEYAIFLHDTPSRELFASDTRTFSSGCIRVEKPLELAAVLLEGQDGWTRERVQQVVERGASETVHLKESLPVVIVYWTVSVGASGEVRFARDVYRQDAPLLRALDTPAGS